MSPRWLVSLTIVAVLPAAARAQVGGADFFEARIRPIFAEACVSCHGEQKQRGDIRLDGRDHLVKDRVEGPVIDLKQPKKSRLLRAVRHEGEYKMPPKGEPLSASAIADLEAWIEAGAPWPGTSTAVKSAKPAAEHWAFRPVVRAPAPRVKDAAWASTPVDAFVLAKLESRGLSPNPPADRRALLRRLKFDLLGLPPTAEEVEAFAADDSPDAYAGLVERYLASPQYGERWGRHWLDVARYADTKGYLFRNERRFAYSYTYRDYVVKAFNDDVPFDRFVREQLAADRLVERGEAEPASLAAMGFLTLGRRFLNNPHDIIDDRIDVVTRGLLGLTVQCARCHDHKYDPIPMKDYYSLYGVFANSIEPERLPWIAEAEPTPAFLAFKAKDDELDSAVSKFREAKKDEIAKGRRDVTDQLRELVRQLEKHRIESPGTPPGAMVLVDAPSPKEPRVFLRGNPKNPGPTVPRQFLEVAAVGPRRPFQDGSGRLELADAIAARDNPLTARVLVNRVWLHHFGRGLVDSPSDFGVRTDPPTHPELLDHLAARFMDESWSIKSLHRWIVLSSTYRQSSEPNAAAAAIDPENRLLARAPRRRLEFESLRDSILAAAGTLDLAIGGRAVDIVGPKPSPRRTIYGFIDRQNLPGLFRTFDLASPDATAPQRHQTTVPQQALFLLNGPFLLAQAKALANRPEIAETESSAGKINALYRILFARDADPVEIRLGESFVSEAGRNVPWERYAQVLLMSNEFAFVD